MKIIHIVCIFCLAWVVSAVNCSVRQEPKEDGYSRQRKLMVETQIRDRGIRNKYLLDALMHVPRHQFVPDEYKKFSYDDRPLPIGYNQTISQPYVVAYMTEILDPDSSKRVLEIGTGSGYQAAILSRLYKEVYTIEIIEALGRNSKTIFEKEGYKNIQVKIGDGYLGWPEKSPFDAIIVTCAPDNIPSPLVDQLAEGGRMIIPVGNSYDQVLYLLEKRNGKIKKTATLPVMFVPMLRDNSDN
jgi:protein-L-isoaspartate(D-aspartate) O-methyltransferase